MTTSPTIFRTVDDLRVTLAGWRHDGLRIALVPTMGALHEGHLDLVRAARQHADRVVVSVFVNPTQFGPKEDFGSYPRTEASDVEKLATLGVEAVFAPSAAEMYPEGYATTISMTGPALGLETDFRPHFFAGVATVVGKLLIAVMPDVAVFGEKDYQQLMVVRRLVRDLRLPTEILGLATVREKDGLALSSRNAYLSAEERRLATTIARVMGEAADAIRAGGAVEPALETGRAALAAAGFRVDYLVLRNAETLAELTDPASEPRRMLAAAWLGKTRLIDNIAV
ncbi:pantoate--beta-alanine ligase [Kaistia adipata]|uniref:pantoate--beta-alanine ligase n=1 Tax=Kaistia adipata TaxID=166954 RepID=UPI0003F5A685|nr:pantoate--beta-alanine ligase [Kaistia adipata]